MLACMATRMHALLCSKPRRRQDRLTQYCFTVVCHCICDKACGTTSTHQRPSAHTHKHTHVNLPPWHFLAPMVVCSASHHNFTTHHLMLQDPDMPLDSGFVQLLTMAASCTCAAQSNDDIPMFSGVLEDHFSSGGSTHKQPGAHIHTHLPCCRCGIVAPESDGVT